MGCTRIALCCALWSCTVGTPASEIELGRRDSEGAADLFQHARATFRAQGVVVRGSPGSPGIELSLRSWGRRGAFVSAGSPEPAEGQCAVRASPAPACHGRVHYARDRLIEWWEDLGDGLEQGFTVPVPPAGSGPLLFELDVRGATVDVDAADRTSATFSLATGASFTYDELAAWDESGRLLPAWMEATHSGIRLVVDDSGARGAVTVDPLLTLGWRKKGKPIFEQGEFGASVSAGDVNADGFTDVIVGAPNRASNDDNPGSVSSYLGSSSGLDKRPQWTDSLPFPNDQQLFGGTVAAGGDVDGDGFADVLVTAPDYGALRGGVSLYRGSAVGVSKAPSWTRKVEVNDFTFGHRTAWAGDVDGDGYDDVLVSALGLPKSAIFLYRGSPTGPGSSPDWTLTTNQVAGILSGVAAAGDVNGDGFGDFAVSATQTVHVFHGSATGPGPLPDWTAVAELPEGKFGDGLASAGDVNADGFSDLVVGDPSWDCTVSAGGGLSNCVGRVYAYLGSTSGLAATAAWTFEADSISNFATSLAPAGDVNADGFDDVIIADPLDDETASRLGVVRVFLGSPLGLLPTAAWTEEGNLTFAQFGDSVSPGGDVNGDGYADIVVGQPFWAGGGFLSVGQVYVYFGACFDDTADADGDTIGDACDLCDGFDDLLDTDLDGIPDGCDP